MKLMFSYVKHKEKVIPICYLEEAKLNPLTGYLNDPMGGLNYFSFLDRSLSILRDENVREADISSNSWGVEIQGNEVFFYFLFSADDKEFQLSLPRAVFIDILVLWLIFLSQEPQEGMQQELTF